MKKFTKNHRYIVNLNQSQEKFMNTYLAMIEDFKDTFLYSHDTRHKLTVKELLNIENSQKKYIRMPGTFIEKAAKIAHAMYQKSNEAKALKKLARLHIRSCIFGEESIDYDVNRNSIIIKPLGEIFLLESDREKFSNMVSHKQTTEFVSITRRKKTDIWYIDIVTETDEYNLLWSEEQTEGIGIDVGLDIMFAVSDESIYPNITRDQKFLSNASRMMEINERIEDLKEALDQCTSNKSMNKLKGKIYQSEREMDMYRIQNTIIVDDYIDEVLNKIFAKNPRFIITENLNNFIGYGADSRMKALHIDYFMSALERHANDMEIPWFIAPVDFPSSKLCSRCGKHVKYVNRKAICKCGATFNRDLNAAINLQKLGQSMYDSYTWTHKTVSA